MLGAIVGDIIGSVHEGTATKTTAFDLCSPRCRFTDDSVLTVAVADTLLTASDYAGKFREYFARYPGAGADLDSRRPDGRRNLADSRGI